MQRSLWIPMIALLLAGCMGEKAPDGVPLVIENDSADVLAVGGNYRCYPSQFEEDSYTVIADGGTITNTYDLQLRIVLELTATAVDGSHTSRIETGLPPGDEITTLYLIDADSAQPIRIEPPISSCSLRVHAP